MALEALLARLEGRAVTPVTADEIPDVTPRPVPILACTPVTSVTAHNDDTASKATSKPPSDPTAEARRQRVLAILAENPNIQRALLVDNPDINPVLLTLAIRDVGTCELSIPRDRYDHFKIIDLLDRYAGATVH